VAGFKGNEIAAEKATDLAQYGLAAADLSIAVSGEEGTLGIVLANRAATGGTADAEAKSYVTATDTGIVYGVTSYAFDRLDKKAADFRDLPATPAPSGAGIVTPPAEPGDALNGDKADGEDFGGEDEGFGNDEDE